MKHNLTSIAILNLALLILTLQQPATGNEISLQQVDSAALLIPAGNAGRFTRLQPVSSRINARVSGMSTRVEVQQSFQNDSPSWMEAVYVFPLPDNASVDTLEMTIGERTIKGILQTRSKARKTYQQAKDSGKRTSLLEQQRANLFTSRVANIPPGEKIDVMIAYQSAPRYSDGQFNLRIPLTMTQRYIPGQRLQSMPDTEHLAYEATSSGWARPTDQVTDADEITPPMAAAGFPNTTEITLSIDSGIDLESVESPSHAITSTLIADIWKVTLANQRTAMDRDFELLWTPAPGASPHAAVFREDHTSDSGSETFASIMLIPPQEFFESVSTGREVIFVIDTSGSMQGNSIVQARQALQLGIDRLELTDTFNVIEFNDSPHKLFASAQPANDENLRYANQWVQNLNADGGTEISAAINAALNQQHTHTATQDESQIRQIVFITDGSVGNEEAIFHQLQQQLGQNRLFTIGIGSSPNTWFMRKAAEIGRGSYTYIARDNEVQEKMLALFHKLESPVLTDLSLNWEGVSAPEIYPRTVPDLYAGEPVLADARWSHAIGAADLIVSGYHAGQPWSRRLQIAASNTDIDPVTGKAAATPKEDKGLYKLWARRKIDDLENSLLFGTDHEQVETEVTETALDYGLVTRYTSLVAVEEEITRDTALHRLDTAAVPSIMPAGNTMHFPQGSLGIGMRLLLTLMFSVLAIVFSLATLRQVQELR